MLLHDEDAASGVSVVVGTRGRGASVASTVESLLASTGVDVEVLVIDQNDDDATEDALGPFLADPRVRYLRSTTVGVSAARNVGLRAAGHPLVLITDDDVTVPPDWCRSFAAALAPHERVAVAYCIVDAAPHDPAQGFIPAHDVRRPVIVRSLLGKSRVRGLGAGMAVRRDAVLAFGGFDEQLGPGAPMRSAEDRDIATRALRAGWWVSQTPEARVLHHGFRTFAEGRDLTRRDWYGIGAAYAKQVKRVDPRIVPVLAHEVLFYGLLEPMVHAPAGHRLRGLKRLYHFGAGLVHGLRTPLDPTTLVYRPRQGAA